MLHDSEQNPSIRNGLGFRDDLAAGDAAGLSERLSLGHMAAGLASVMLAGTATDAWSQTADTLPTIEVQDATGGGDNTTQADTGVARLGRVQDIPQTVNVINERTLREQGVTTLDQALRNVPGVTVAIGEGGGGLNGDQFRIRGFQAKGDIYTDGLRDFGAYTRDSFAYEQIQVLKGPTSESFGIGTTGGAINNVMKSARLGNFMDIQGTLGMGPTYRGVVDINRQLDETTAVRIVGMGHKQELVDRDHVYSDRWGVLGSVGFGLGTSENLTINYFHQSGKRLPDMGQPIITPAGRIGRPISEFGVPRSNYYGYSSDVDDYSVNALTLRYKNEVTDWLTVTNDLRVSHYTRTFLQTVTGCPNPVCVNGVASGNFNVPYSIGGPQGYDQTSQGVQNITTAVAKLQTGSLRHELVVGLDVFMQQNERQGYSSSLANGAKAVGTIANPLFEPNFIKFPNPADQRDASNKNVALFASDRVWLTDQFSILGGVRVDRYSAKYNTPTSSASAGDTMVSPKASVIWEPTPNQTYYATWARSYSNVAGEFVANSLNVISNATLEPERNDLWEIGGKVNLFGDRLGLTAALFRVNKGNSIQTDPTTGDIVQTNEEQLVQGIELGVTGKITEDWTVQAAYAYMDSEIKSATAANQATIGNRVSYVPEHAASLWTTYNVAPMLQMPGKLLVGGGFTYTDSYFVNSANTAVIPSAFVWNGLVSYEYENYRLAVNFYNLTDELYYDTAFGNRAVVAAGRTVMVTAGYRW